MSTGNITDLATERARKELHELMQVKFLCGKCSSPLFMIYNGVAQCAMCDDLIKITHFEFPEDE